MLCNNARVDDGVLHGQPTEGAILIAAQKIGMRDLRGEVQRFDEIPFTHDEKWMAVRCGASHDSSQWFVKGAVERVLQRCNRLRERNGATEMKPTTARRIMEDAHILAGSAEGLRVLAMARGEDLDRLEFMGFVGIHDPPRPGVQKAIELLRLSGVQIIMVTGDGKDTACAIGKIRC